MFNFVFLFTFCSYPYAFFSFCICKISNAIIFLGQFCVLLRVYICVVLNQLCMYLLSSLFFVFAYVFACLPYFSQCFLVVLNCFFFAKLIKCAWFVFCRFCLVTLARFRQLVFRVDSFFFAVHTLLHTNFVSLHFFYLVVEFFDVLFSPFRACSICL